MTYYPMFVDLGGKDILVAGAGSVGRRKIAGLAKASPRLISVVDPTLNAVQMSELEELGHIRCFARAFCPEDIPGKFLVFATTNNREVNALIAKSCANHGVLCNSVDAPEQGGFIVPAHFSQKDLTVAVSTGGHSPALARLLREDLETYVGKRYTPLLTVMGRLRPLLLALGLTTRENTVLFRTLVRSPLAEHLESGNITAAANTLADLLPKPLLDHVGDLLHGY